MIKNWQIKKWQMQYVENLELLFTQNGKWNEIGYDYSNDEVLELELRALRNYILWRYNTKKMGVPVNVKNDMNSFIDFVRDSEKTGISETPKVKMNLKDKCIVSNAWCPEKLYEIEKLDLDFSDRVYRNYHYIYFENLGIGTVTSGGNHRMFVQSIRNLDKEAEIDVLHDRNVLERFRTDGSFFYEIDNPSNKISIADERIALLVTLTQVKLGIIEDFAQYIAEARVMAESDKFPYETEEDALNKRDERIESKREQKVVQQRAERTKWQRFRDAIKASKKAAKHAFDVEMENRLY